MSKKHFIALADALRATKPAEFSNAMQTATMRAQWNADVEAIANFCQAENHGFMRGRWLAYINGECGPSGGKKKCCD